MVALNILSSGLNQDEDALTHSISFQVFPELENLLLSAETSFVALGEMHRR